MRYLKRGWPGTPLLPMKRLLFCLCCLIGLSAPGQTDTALLHRAKDYTIARFSAALASRIIPGKYRTHAWLLQTAVKKSSLLEPFPCQALTATLTGGLLPIKEKFTLLAQALPTSRFAILPQERSIPLLVEELYQTLRRQYGPIVPLSVRDTVKKDLLLQLRNEVYQTLPTYVQRIDTHASKLPLSERIPPTVNRFKNDWQWPLLLLLLLLAAVAAGWAAWRRLKERLNGTEQDLQSLQEKESSAAPEKGHLNAVYAEYRSLVTARLSELMDRMDTTETLLQKLQNPEAKTPVPPPAPEEPLNPDVELPLATPPPAIAPAPAEPIPFSGSFLVPAPQPSFFDAAASGSGPFLFTRLPGMAEASFELVADEALLEEVKMERADWLQTACTFTNRPMPYHRQLLTSIRGRAVLQNDRWVIRQKAILLFV